MTHTLNDYVYTRNNHSRDKSLLWFDESQLWMIHDAFQALKQIKTIHNKAFLLKEGWILCLELVSCHWLLYGSGRGRRVGGGERREAEAETAMEACRLVGRKGDQRSVLNIQVSDKHDDSRTGKLGHTALNGGSPLCPSNNSYSSHVASWSSSSQQLGVKEPSVFWSLLQPSSTLSLSVFSLAALLFRRTPVSPPPLHLPFCSSHPPTCSQHCTVSTLSSPASSRFYDSV